MDALQAFMFEAVVNFRLVGSLAGIHVRTCRQFWAWLEALRAAVFEGGKPCGLSCSKLSSTVSLSVALRAAIFDTVVDVGLVGGPAGCHV